MRKCFKKLEEIERNIWAIKRKDENTAEVANWEEKWRIICHHSLERNIKPTDKKALRAHYWIAKKHPSKIASIKRQVLFRVELRNNFVKGKGKITWRLNRI